MLRRTRPRSRFRFAIVAIVATFALTSSLVACSSDDHSDATTDPPTSASASATTGPTCGQTTAEAEETLTFTFSHDDTGQGVETSDDNPSFAHVQGVIVMAAEDNTEALSITISALDGATVATINDVAPGVICGIDYDFAPGDYFIESSDGNGTQFSSFADQVSASTPSAATDDTATATLTYKGQTYEFTGGRCSDVLDEDQFVFRSPPDPGIDPTYFAIVVTDLDGATSSDGGEYSGAVNYQKDAASVMSISGGGTLVVADDLRSGTFTGEDFFTHEPASGSWTCD